MASSATADIKGYEKDENKDYVVFTIQVSFRNSTWSVAKRYSDFVALRHRLTREFREKDLRELPGKRFWRRFDKDFLDVRMQGLQAFLSTILEQIPCADSDAMLEFLEVTGRVDVSQPPLSYNAVNDEFAAEQEEFEQRRLAALVENFANSLMDSSSVGVEPRDDEEVEAQREKLLRRVNGFSEFDDHLKSFFNGDIPNGAEKMGHGNDDVMESLHSDPILSEHELNSSRDQSNMGVDAKKQQAHFQGRQSLVCHMSNM